jgi:glycosyltransferase involved in cell wall biosynthesis
MVRTLIEGLPARGIAVHHVNLGLSADIADIGRWQWGKAWKTICAACSAVRARITHACDTLYYVPAPAKRGALYRDWTIMLLCRPFFRRLVLHWHSVGLGQWLETAAHPLERWITQALLGRADLSIVLAPELSADASRLNPRRVAVVPNCIPDPHVQRVSSSSGRTLEVLFLGMCSRDKGLFDTLEGVALASASSGEKFRLTVAGEFATPMDQSAFQARVAQLPAGLISYTGFVDATQKRRLLEQADVLCLPTTYAHEAQPLVLIEALAHDVSIVTTRWRGIPSLLPSEHVWFVAAGEPRQIADALIAARAAPRPQGALRRHYLERFTPERHLAAMSETLNSTSAK